MAPGPIQIVDYLVFYIKPGTTFHFIRQFANTGIENRNSTRLFGV